jgi:hypothetical protein
MKKFVCKYVVGLLVVALIVGCKGVRPAAGGGGGGLVQVFVKGKDSLLCHAGPIPYHSAQSGERFEIDHTYMKVKNQRNQVVCNFSVFTTDPSFWPEHLSIQLKEKRIEVSSITKFYAEGYGKKKYHHRYSFTVSDVDFNLWMLDESPIIEVGGKTFEGKRSFRKDAKRVYRMILFDAF